MGAYGSVLVQMVLWMEDHRTEEWEHTRGRRFVEENIHSELGILFVAAVQAGSTTMNRWEASSTHKMISHISGAQDPVVLRNSAVGRSRS